VHFEALEQTRRLRLVSGPVDKSVFLSVGTVSIHTAHPYRKVLAHLQLKNWTTALFHFLAGVF